MPLTSAPVVEVVAPASLSTAQVVAAPVTVHKEIQFEPAGMDDMPPPWDEERFIGTPAASIRDESNAPELELSNCTLLVERLFGGMLLLAWYRE